MWIIEEEGLKLQGQNWYRPLGSINILEELEEKPFYQIFKEIMSSVSHKIFQITERKKPLLNLFYNDGNSKAGQRYCKKIIGQYHS